MIGTIRKHSTWLWFVIIGAMILGLVYVFQPGSSMFGTPRGTLTYGWIDGHPLRQDEMADADREIRLRYFLMHNTWPDQEAAKAGFDENGEVYDWVFLLSKLKEYNVQVDPEAAAAAVSDYLRQIGNGTQVPFDTYVEKVLMPHGMTAEDFERLIRHELGRMQLISVLGLSGRLIEPSDAQFLYERDHQEVESKAVFFLATNYLAAVPVPTPEALARYYTNEMSAYRVPERVRVRYVAFGLSNYLAQAQKQLTNLDALVDTQMRQLGTNYVRFAKTPEEVKSRVRRELLQRQAAANAQRVADEFANDLFGMEPVAASNLDTLAKTNGLEVKLTMPFEEEVGPTDFDGGPDFSRQAFRLSADKPFPEQPIVGADAIYIIALDQRIPDEVLPLERIRDRVTADYRLGRATLVARAAGDSFVSSATNGLARGKTFDAICAEAKVRPITVPPVSLTTRELPAVEDLVPLNQYKQLALGTPTGKVSDFGATRDGGFVVYPEKRLPVDTSKMRAELPAFTKLVQRTREQEAFRMWFLKERNVSLRAPGMQAQRGNAPGEPGGE